MVRSLPRGRGKVGGTFRDLPLGQREAAFVCQMWDCLISLANFLRRWLILCDIC